GDAWQDTALVRRALVLDLLTPYDFGEGDPFADGVGEELARRTAVGTGGAVTQMTWRFADRWKVPRRPATTALDVFHPGDPADGRAEAAEQLRRRLGKDLSAHARQVLESLTVGGVSTHRLWLVAPDEDVRRGVGRTPGAAFALRDAIRRQQRSD